MPEITDDELYFATLQAVRNYCGWHVTPIKVDHVVILDGPGEAILPLPTKRLITLSSVVEDGVVLNLADLAASANGRTLVKKSGAWWSSKPSAITVTMTHGYDTALDFDNAVLSAMARSSSGSARQVAGPFQYVPQGPSEEEKLALDAYRILPLI